MSPCVESWADMSSRLDAELAALLAGPCEVSPVTRERASLADLHAELAECEDYSDDGDPEGVL